MCAAFITPLTAAESTPARSWTLRLEGINILADERKVVTAPGYAIYLTCFFNQYHWVIVCQVMRRFAFISPLLRVIPCVQCRGRTDLLKPTTQFFFLQWNESPILIIFLLDIIRSCIIHRLSWALLEKFVDVHPCLSICYFPRYCISKSLCTHCVKVREEAEGRGPIESEGQEVLEVELRLQRPSRDREGSQERAALGRRTLKTHRHMLEGEKQLGKINMSNISLRL